MAVSLLRRALDAWRFKKAMWAIEREMRQRTCPSCGAQGQWECGYCAAIFNPVRLEEKR